MGTDGQTGNAREQRGPRVTIEVERLRIEVRPRPSPSSITMLSDAARRALEASAITISAVGIAWVVQSALRDWTAWP